MYLPTENERKVCTKIVKDILSIDDGYQCEKYVDKIFSVAYSIGADYGEKTLITIAKNYLKELL